MLPAVQDDLKNGFEFSEIPTNTLAAQIGGNRVVGRADGIQAMRQAVYLILSVERYEWLIHSWNYGVELRDLYGQPVNYCIPEIERRITEALMQDDRIKGVENFEFSTDRGKITATFTVKTIFGDVPAEKEVEV